MESQVEKTVAEAKSKIEKTQSPKDLEKVYLEIFGKNGILTKLTKEISRVKIPDRPKFGRLINRTKEEISAEFERRKKELSKKKGAFIDVTAPGKKRELGHLHLVSQAIAEIVSIFAGLGFRLQSYPEVDWDLYAFESLNMPKNHPARDDWETFFIKAPQKTRFGNQVLTPHTSNGQVREMERVKNPPIRMLNIARCYRRQIDVSHTPMFHQFEGLLVDKDVSVPQLKGTFDYFTKRFFGPQRVTRLRPHHFRFTEPSFEVDVTCSICLGKGCRLCKDGWLELGGAGMVHPKVLKAGKIDPQKYSGFAFGWGVERTIAMRTDVSDIRILYQNDTRFLEQF